MQTILPLVRAPSLQRHIEALAKLGGRVTARDVKRHLWRYRDSRAAQALLEVLVAEGVGVWQRRGPTPAGGRPTREFVFKGGLNRTRQNVVQRQADTMWFELQQIAAAVKG